MVLPAVTVCPGAASVPTVTGTQSRDTRDRADLRPSWESPPRQGCAGVGQEHTAGCDRALWHVYLTPVWVCLWASWSWGCGHSGATESPAACLGLLQLCVGKRSVATSLCLEDYPSDLSCCLFSLILDLRVPGRGFLEMMTGCTRRMQARQYHKTNLGYTKAFQHMICAIQTLLCGDTSSGINTAISPEALKRHCSSSVHLAFKLSALKPKGDNGGGSDGTGSRRRRCVPVSHPPAHPSAHQQLIAVGQR